MGYAEICKPKWALRTRGPGNPTLPFLFRENILRILFEMVREYVLIQLLVSQVDGGMIKFCFDDVV